MTPTTTQEFSKEEGPFLIEDLILYSRCKDYLHQHGFMRIDEDSTRWYQRPHRNPYDISLAVAFIEKDYTCVIFRCPQLAMFPLCVEDFNQFKTFVLGIKYINKTYRVFL